MYGSPPANRPFPSSPYGHRKEESEVQVHQSQNPMGPGLLRYRSAPSSLFGEDFLPVRPSSPETETILARFLSPDLRDKQQQPVQRNPQLPAEENARMLYQQQQQQITSNPVTSIGMESSSNLVRQSSSPAGLFSPLNVENGYGVTRGIGGFRNGNDGGNRLRSQLSFSSRQSSSAAAMMSQISEEMENEESMGGYPIGSWEDSPMVSENDFKRARENQSEFQNGAGRNGLTHQFSLPKTSSEIAAIEKFLQFQDSVPCKIRAKRGCATHPRSIAERVRRTRISERMRKLQELVPNMDKQTNTADMLDLAVDYIKDLQKQVNTISDSRASCTCSSSKQKPYSNSTT